MGKPSAPQPPDYAAAAKEQGVANVNSALATNYLNQVNQVGPNGSLTYSYDPATGHTLSDGTFIPGTTATTTLSPEQQKLYDQNALMSQNLNDIALKGIDYVGQTAGTPIDISKIPPITSSVALNPISGQIAPSTIGLTTSAGTTPMQTSYDFSKAAALPDQSNYMDMRDQITNAMMERLRPQIDRDREAMYNRLANQGINIGAAAYNTDVENFNRGVNDQRIAALLAGDREQQTLFQNQFNLHGQGINEAMSQGNFFNNAQNAKWQQAYANAQMQNAAQAQEFAQNQARQQAADNASQGNFNQGLANANLGNSAANQALQQQEFLRTEPLNMLNALRSGNQVNLPQFGNVATGATIQAAPIYQATADQYNAQLAAYQAQMAARGGLLGGLGSIGGGLASTIKL